MASTTKSQASAHAVPQAPNAERMHQFVGKVLTDCAVSVSATLAVIGDQTGLYRAMAGAGPLTSAEVAARSGTTERYVREWLINQASSGYLTYDPATRRYALPDEHAVPLTDQDSPFYVGGALLIAAAMVRAEPRIAERFATGAGLGWGEHDPLMFDACERLFRPGYTANLVQSWIPALDGVAAKLERGGRVADIGCGHGASTILLAQAYPNAHFFGFDLHAPSIERATEHAKEAGVSARTTFAVASGTDFPGADYDLIAYFDCLHDMGDPANSLRHAGEALAPDGTVMLVEPMAGNQVEENFNPVGQFYSGASVLICTPNALATGGTALGTVATDEALAEVARVGGLTHFRRALETPLNRIFELKR
jgi:SAM-dependent methyltransferase